jgi:hypothetical protein
VARCVLITKAESVKRIDADSASFNGACFLNGAAGILSGTAENKPLPNDYEKKITDVGQHNFKIRDNTVKVLDTWL